MLANLVTCTYPEEKRGSLIQSALGLPLRDQTEDKQQVVQKVVLNLKSLSASSLATDREVDV